MTAVFDHYSETIARYLRQGFSFQSRGRTLRFDGLRSRFDLHDLVAETFRRAFEERARQGYHGLTPYEGYLRTIARNLVLDGLRTGASWTAREAGGVAEPNERVPSVEQVYQQAELAQLLQSFLGELERAERAFVSLRYVEGLSQEEVASRLGRSRRWSRSTERDLRRRLLRHLRGTGYLPRSGAAAAEGPRAGLTGGR